MHQIAAHKASRPHNSAQPISLRTPEWTWHRTHIQDPSDRAQYMWSGDGIKDIAAISLRHGEVTRRTPEDHRTPRPFKLNRSVYHRNMKKPLKQGARLWVFWFHPEHQPDTMKISEATFIQFDDQGDLIYILHSTRTGHRPLQGSCGSIITTERGVPLAVHTNGAKYHEMRNLLDVPKESRKRSDRLDTERGNSFHNIIQCLDAWAGQPDTSEPAPQNQCGDSRHPSLDKTGPAYSFSAPACTNGFCAASGCQDWQKTTKMMRAQERRDQKAAQSAGSAVATAVATVATESDLSKPLTQTEKLMRMTKKAQQYQQQQQQQQKRSQQKQTRASTAAAAATAVAAAAASAVAAVKAAARTAAEAAAAAEKAAAEVAKVAEVTATVAAEATAAVEKDRLTQEEVETHLSWLQQRCCMPDDEPEWLTDEDHEEGVRRGRRLRQIREHIDYNGDDFTLQVTTAEATYLFAEMGLMTEDSPSSEDDSSTGDSDEGRAEPDERRAAAPTATGGESARRPAGRPPLGQVWCPTRGCYVTPRAQGQQSLPFAPAAVAGATGMAPSTTEAEINKIAAEPAAKRAKCVSRTTTKTTTTTTTTETTKYEYAKET